MSSLLLRLDYCESGKRQWCVKLAAFVCISYFLYIWIMLDLGQKRPYHKLWHSPGECVFLHLPEETTPPFPILNLPFPPSFSHHNIVFISPLRLNPSLPVRCGKRHFENEIGYINSSAITLAIAFSLYSSSETWLTSTTTPMFLTKCKGKRQHIGLALSAESNWEQWGEGKGEDYPLFIWSTHGGQFLLTSTLGAGASSMQWMKSSLLDRRFIISSYSGSILVCSVKCPPQSEWTGQWCVSGVKKWKTALYAI